MANADVPNPRNIILDIVLNKEAVEDPNQAILVYKDGGINTVGETKNNRGM